MRLSHGAAMVMIMPMLPIRTVSATHLDLHVAETVNAALLGQRTVVTKYGRPVCAVVPLKRPTGRRAAPRRSRWTAEDVELLGFTLGAALASKESRR